VDDALGVGVSVAMELFLTFLEVNSLGLFFVVLGAVFLLV